VFALEDVLEDGEDLGVDDAHEGTEGDPYGHRRPEVRREAHSHRPNATQSTEAAIRGTLLGKRSESLPAKIPTSGAPKNVSVKSPTEASRTPGDLTRNRATRGT